MYEKDQTRIASSELADVLFGGISKYQKLLEKEKDNLRKNFPDEVILDSMFNGIPKRIINICPMVLCDKLCLDLLGKTAPDSLLTGIGLSMYPISTHDDLVDEFPHERMVVAGLAYTGDIAALQGAKILIENGFADIMAGIIEDICMNHYYQTLIVNSIWKESTDEAGYMRAISHTKYWAMIGLKAAMIYADRNDLNGFVRELADCYGTTCQLFDDMREIDDDVSNGYWSLPIILAKENNWDIMTSGGKNKSIERSRELAMERIMRAREICKNDFPQMENLIQKPTKAMSLVGFWRDTL
jgi:hypothetical protein